MKIENKNEAQRLEFFKALYQCAENSYAQQLEDFDRAMKQYKGSTEIDGSDEAAITVRNITYEIVESQVSSSIPSPKADAASYSEKRGRNATSIERLCRSIRSRLPFEEMNDMDERYTYIYGGSVWYIDWDNTSEYMGEVGGVRVECLSPCDFIPQPNIYEIDDMEYCFLKFITTRSELTRQYGIPEDMTDLADFEFEYDGDVDASDTVKVITCFYRDEDGEIGRFIFSGDLTLSDLPRYYGRKKNVCVECGEDEEVCRCKKKKVKQEDVHFERILFPTDTCACGEIPYYVPKTFPIVIRKNTSAEKKLFGQSDCDYIRPEQQAINKIESRILQKLLRSGVTPIIPEDASVSLNNSVFGQVIRMKPGESADQYGTVDTTPSLEADMKEADRLYDHSKRILGISDA